MRVTAQGDPAPDPGFDAVGYALSHRTLSSSVERGLAEYAKLYRDYPEVNGLGLLLLSGTSKDRRRLVPELVTPEFQAKVNAEIFVPTLVGIVLLVWSGRRRKPA